jgi:TRAP-type C4-dicarboxylate transport system permease small subunit
MIMEKIIGKELDPEFQKLWNKGFLVRMLIVIVGFVGFAIYRMKPFSTMSENGAILFCVAMVVIGAVLGVQLQTYDFMIAFGKAAYASRRKGVILIYWIFSLIWYILLLTLTLGGLIYFSLEN